MYYINVRHTRTYQRSMKQQFLSIICFCRKWKETFSFRICRSSILYFAISNTTGKIYTRITLLNFTKILRQSFECAGKCQLKWIFRSMSNNNGRMVWTDYSRNTWINSEERLRHVFAYLSDTCVWKYQLMASDNEATILI